MKQKRFGTIIERRVNSIDYVKTVKYILVEIRF